MAVNDSSNTDFIFCSFLFLYINVVWFTPYRKQPVFLNTPLQKKKQLKKKKRKGKANGFSCRKFFADLHSQASSLVSHGLSVASKLQKSCLNSHLFVSLNKGRGNTPYMQSSLLI